MLFNSAVFLFGFLPLTLVLFHGLRAFGRTRGALGLLAAASLVFYGYWDVRFLPVLLTSILVNYGFGVTLLRTADAAAGRRALLAAGLAFNLGLLGYFKYANFAVATAEQLTGTDFAVRHVVLPLGISFFTFQKIAFLIDAYRRRIAGFDFLNYLLFVTFFPQLIAGPIVHHGEVMPQFAAQTRGRLGPDLAVGLTIFTIGLFKKMALADTLALSASPVFDAAATGYHPSAAEAWQAMLCYALQIYFDFSGYSDMAVGLGRMFGVRLPVNFASPYKATGIVDFWRRWHVTLSRFLRDYLYTALGGNRRGGTRRTLNVFLTMLLGGIWHGAGWTFVLWGAMHGVMIVLDQLRLARFPGFGRRLAPLGPWPGRVTTFLLVALAWVPFRAADLGTTFRMYGALAGAPGGLPGAGGDLVSGDVTYLALLLLLGVWLLPNTYEIMARHAPALPSRGYPATEVRPDDAPRLLRWRPSPAWATAVALAFTVCLLKLNDISEFIYFQF